MLPKLRHVHISFLLLLWLALIPLVTASSDELTVNSASTSPPPETSSLRTPILMLFTVDGTVTFYDARTGADIFAHRDKRPAVESWTSPGMHQYIPSLDGRLFRINTTTDEIQLVESNFIHRAADSTFLPPKRAQQESDTIILKSEDSSALYVDLSTGKLVHQLSFDNNNTPVLPTLSDNIIIVSRTTVGIRIVESATGRQLANATLVHTEPSFLDYGRCSNTPIQTDSLVASVSSSRRHISVRDIPTGRVLWSRDIETPVVEAHGLAGLRIGDGADLAALPHSSQTQEALPITGSAARTIARQEFYVTSHDPRKYGMLAAPEPVRGQKDATSQNSLKSKHDGNMRKYTISQSAETARSAAHAIFGTDRPKSPNDQQQHNQETNRPQVAAQSSMTAREFVLGLVLLAVVGYVGYITGNPPRRHAVDNRSTSGYSPRRHSTVPEMDVRGESGNRFRSSSGIEDERDMQNLIQTGKSINQNGIPQNRKGSEADTTLEASNESNSSGTGYMPNRSESGWMTVGNLEVSSVVLGVGSHGTVVFEGKMQPGDRKVAVKRLLRQFYESARKEISLLVELDEASPHVVRYFAMQEDSEFIYLALELCAGSLAERVNDALPPGPPKEYQGGPSPPYTSRALRQLLQGLADLHRVGVVHRDVKPQNVLITRSEFGMGDVKLADVGLALRLAANRSSYTAVSNAGGGVGTTGWRAPEVLSGDRQTKAVDIFAAGCVVSVVLTGGKHPFGNAIFRRDGNIAAGRHFLDDLVALKLPEATDVVKKMIDPVAANRPTAEEALNHPFFWTDATKLSFLVDISDRLYDLRYDRIRYTEDLDRYPYAVEHCSDWRIRMDMDLLLDLQRQYETTPSCLLRIIRNKRNHYSELSAQLRTKLGALPEEAHSTLPSTKRSRHSADADKSLSNGHNFLTYFTSRVPHLLLSIYRYALENPPLINQPHFARYGLKPQEKVREKLILNPKTRRAKDMPSNLVTSDGVGDFNRPTAGITMKRDTHINNPNERIEVLRTESDEVVVTISTDRRAYHRHELITIQQRCQKMDDSVKRLAIIGDIYQPSAYERYRKRLTTNEFKISDIPADLRMELNGNLEEAEEPVPPGFHRPNRNGQHGKSSFGSRAPPYPSSLARPPGFGTGGGGSSNHQNNHHKQQGRRAGPVATLSQFSGEERVVDFSSLRRVKQ